MRILKSHPITIAFNNMLIDLPTPIAISFAWNFGSILGLLLVSQILTGFFLTQHYTSDVDLAFSSIDLIMREINYGWVLRYSHATGASFFLGLTYLHIGRGLYFGSFKRPRHLLWFSGIVIYLLLMATAFLGYTLVWGSMSLWGSVVITNLLSAIPVVGNSITHWIWGGFSVGNPTLQRFFAIHYLLPFILAALVIIHLVLLHEFGSSNPTGLNSSHDKTRFHTFFTTKDLLGFIIVIIFFSFFIFFEPDVLGHSDNFNVANPLVTPPSIVPEWYFLPAYAMLRSIPNKLAGVLVMIGSILILTILPLVNRSTIRSANYKPISCLFFWLFVFNFLLLGYLGQKPAETPFVLISQLATWFYFSYFTIIIPIFETR